MKAAVFAAALVTFGAFLCLSGAAVIAAQTRSGGLKCGRFANILVRPEFRPYTRPPQRMAEITAEAASHPYRVVFLGDSLTQLWNRQTWHRYFSQFSALNAGVGGDRADHLLWRIDNGMLGHQNPKVFILLIGTNDLTLGRPPAVVAEEIRSIVLVLREQSPNSHILLEGLWPRDDRPGMRQKTEAVNRLLAECDGGAVTYVDFDQALVDSRGKLLPTAFLYDRLHLSPEGYRRISPRIAARLRQLIAADQS